MGAKRYPDDVPDEVKKRRNNELLAIQNQISEEDNQVFLGQRVQVLVEGPSKWSAKGKAPADDGVPRLPTPGATPQPNAFPYPGHVSTNPDQDLVSLGQPGAMSEGWSHGDQPTATENQQHLLQLTGRTLCDRIVVFEGNARLIGQFVDVGIYDISPFTLLGTVLTQHQTPQLMQLQ